jgi:hypothetical protein
MHKPIALFLLALSSLLFAGCPPPVQPTLPTQTRSCEEHTDCAEGLICEGGECRPGQCVPGDFQQECNTPSMPEALAGYCCKPWQLCNVLNQCTANPNAVVGNQCLIDDDCPGLGQFCSGGNCYDTGGRDACTNAFQCPAGERCDRTVFLCVPDNGGCTFADLFPELACEAAQVCDVETGFCLDPGGEECTEQTVAQDCRPNQKCDALGRCVQCTANSDCGPGTACNQGTGNCYSVLNRCDSDADCTGGRRCSPATNECVSPQCEADSDCPDNRQTCDLGTFTCFLPPAVCPNEVDEPNDTPGTATPITLAGYAGSLCRGNTDYLSFPVLAGKRYRATITFPDFNVGGTAVAMLNSQGLVTDNGTLGSFQNSITVSGIAAENGTFLLRIVGSGSAVDSWSYAVAIGETEAPQQVSCADPAANGEPNDTFALAHEIEVGRSYNFARCGRTDVDFYKVTIPPLHGLRVQVEMNAADGDLDVNLYSQVSGSSISSATTGNDVETVTAPEGAREFWVRIILYSGDSNAPTNQTYTITASLVPRSSACDADINEPDGDLQSAGLLPIDTSAQAIRCGGPDVDFFRIDLPPNRGGQARVDFTHSEGDIRLDLLDTAGEVMGSSNTSNSSNGFEVVPLPPSGSASTYYARVRLHAGTGAIAQGYTISTATFNASACTLTEPDPNDTFATGTCVGTPNTNTPCVGASWALPGSWPSLATCASATEYTTGCGSVCGVGDPDYYRVGKLNNGQLLRARLEHEPTAGVLGLSLVRLTPAGAVNEFVAETNTQGLGVLELSAVVPTLAEEFVREYGVLVKPTGTGDFQGQPYALEIEVGPPCVDDAFDLGVLNNDSPATAARLRVNPQPGVPFNHTVSNVTLCGRDVDVYEVFLFQGEQVTATMSGLNGVTVNVGARVYGEPTAEAVTVLCGQGVKADDVAACPGGVNTLPSEHTSPMRASFTAIVADYYYLTVKRAEPFGGIGGYSLQVEVGAPN